MISTLKEVREALAYAGAASATRVQLVLTKLDALIAQVEKAEPQYLSIERVEGFPEKLEQGPQPLLYSDGINGCMVRRDDVWLALTSQLAIPQPAPQQEKAEPVVQPLPGADWTITMRRMMNAGCSKRKCTCKPEDAKNCLWWDEMGDAPHQPAPSTSQHMEEQPDGTMIEVEPTLAAPSTSPLTDEQIDELLGAAFDDHAWRGTTAMCRELSRAIEAAHGIGAKP